ncbi:MAG: hypothetical protein NTW66_04065 [Candidatus Magasanikbacteria bacterium]|nr:hypothetical protein [Candidatus Magasanikbacteria bacterium]
MLSPKAEKLINDYFNLPFEGLSGIRCPYFNNTRRRARGQLRGLIGKGTPEEIVEEAKIISTQYRHNIFDKDGFCCIHAAHSDEEKNDDVRKFLIDNDLGIDCSGFISQALIAHYKETKNINIAKNFYFWPLKNFWRRLVARLRPVENMSVSVIAKDENSLKIADGRETYDWSKLQPADLIFMMETGPNKKRNHILIIEDNEGSIIKYAHSRAWSSDGKYGHGVARGVIRITKLAGNMLDQTWEEQGKTNDENETYREASEAKIFEVRRIKI